jgi:hypothetical protein
MSIYYVRVNGRLVRTGVLPDSAITLAADTIYSISSSLAAADAASNARITADGVRITSLTSTDASFDNRITSLASVDTSFDTRITALTNADTSFNTRITALTAADSALSTRITTLSGALNTFSTTGFSGSLTRLADGNDYLLAGTNVTLSTGSNGAITINSTGGSSGGGSSSSDTVFNLSLNANVLDGAPAASIGAVYIPSTLTLSTNSLAYMGSAASGYTVLNLCPINSNVATATWKTNANLGSSALVSSCVLITGWYDITIESSGSSNNLTTSRYARGLYLTTGN